MGSAVHLFRRTPADAPTSRRNGCASSSPRNAARAAARTTCRCCGVSCCDVIRKYVNVDLEAIQVNFEREDDQEVLELSVALPERQTWRARCRSRRRVSRFALSGSAFSPSPPPTASARSTVFSNASRCAATRSICAWNRPRRTSSKLEIRDIALRRSAAPRAPSPATAPPPAPRSRRARPRSAPVPASASSTSRNAICTVRAYSALRCSRTASARDTFARRRPPWNSGCRMPPDADQASAGSVNRSPSSGADRAERAGQADAAGTAGRARRRCRQRTHSSDASAAPMSGRRSSTDEGNAAGNVAGVRQVHALHARSRDRPGPAASGPAGCRAHWCARPLRARAGASTRASRRRPPRRA